MRGHVARMGEMKNAYDILFGEPDGKRPLGRPRFRWKDKIRMAFKERGWVPSGSLKGGKSLTE